MGIVVVRVMDDPYSEPELLIEDLDEGRHERQVRDAQDELEDHVLAILPILPQHAVHGACGCSLPPLGVRCPFAPDERLAATPAHAGEDDDATKSDDGSCRVEDAIRGLASVHGETEHDARERDDHAGQDIEVADHAEPDAARVVRAPDVSAPGDDAGHADATEERRHEQECQTERTGGGGKCDDDEHEQNRCLRGVDGTNAITPTLDTRPEDAGQKGNDGRSRDERDGPVGSVERLLGDDAEDATLEHRDGDGRQACVAQFAQVVPPTDGRQAARVERTE
jgi:hypothetical protein